MKETEWKYVGTLSTGEMVYRNGYKGLAIEKDHRHLVQPTPEEKRKIYEEFPSLLNRQTQQ